MKKASLFIMICLLFGGFLGYKWLHGIEHRIFIPSVNERASASGNGMAGKLADKVPFAILLIGYGGGNHDGAYLTDSIIVAYIDPKQQKIFLISIPRDIWVKIPTDGQNGNYWKINAAYTLGMDDSNYPNKQIQFIGQDGGGRLVEYMVSQITGVPINYFLGMDFSGFTHTIDTLGGADITVEKTFDDYQYPIEGKEDNSCGLTDTEIASLSAQIASPSATITELDAFPCRFEHLHFDKGLQHMDGTTALKYVRSRHSLQDGTDFGRAQRQRNLIVATKQKLFSVGFIPRLFPFIASLGADLRTDLTPDDLKTLIQNANRLNKYQIINLALTDDNFLQDATADDGQAILEPKDGIDNWTGVHNWIAGKLSNIAEPMRAVIQIENGTGIDGLAQLATNRLKNENLQVLNPTDGTHKAVQKTTITVFDNNVNKSDLDTLQKEFGVSKITQATSASSSYNVLIVVGEDYNQKEGKKLLNEP